MGSSVTVRAALAIAAAASGAACKSDGAGDTGAGGSGATGGAAYGGSAAATGPAACDRIEAAVVARLVPPALRGQLGGTPSPELADRLRVALMAACKHDKWTAQALACLEQRTRQARAACPGRLTAAQERSAQNALVTEGLTALGEPVAGRAPPPVQYGPHPDYPTPALAGTDKLFTMVEPERGPKAPVAMTIPRAGLVWTTHATCELGVGEPICTPATADLKGLFTWRVGKRGKELIVVEARRGTRVERTHVYQLGPDGAPLARIRFDAYDRVESALAFKAPDRYSGRKRNGANALEGCGNMRYALDASGRLTELACLQWSGALMLDTEGVATTRYTRDANGFISETSRFDLDGKPVADPSGVHRTVVERDDRARVKLERYRGIDGKPVASNDGCFGFRFERSDEGALTRQTCLDAADQPVAQPLTGVAIDSYVVDPAGCRIGVRYLNVAGQPAVNHDLVHALDYEVDARCEITVKSCRDKSLRPRSCGGGAPAKYVTQYDAAGNATTIRHYGPYGAPARDPAYHAFDLRRTYDRLGNQLTLACHDSSGLKIVCPNTDFHSLKSEFDDAGRESVQRYYDEDGGPTDNYGSYKRTYRYDNYDHLAESLNHDQAGALTEAFGVATRRDLFDTAHRRFGIVLFGRSGQPATNSGCYTGATCPGRPWHAMRIVRRKDGSVEKNQFFDVDKKLIDTKFCNSTPCFD